jgi:hypothetical protein
MNLARRIVTSVPLFLLLFAPGVSGIEINVEAKTVVVQADESVSPQSMLEKLQKVRNNVHAVLSVYLSL